MLADGLTSSNGTQSAPERAAGIREVLLIGVDTEPCVLATATILFDAGSTVRVSAAGCASTGGVGLHRAGLSVMWPLFGPRVVLDTADNPNPDTP